MPCFVHISHTTHEQNYFVIVHHHRFIIVIMFLSGEVVKKSAQTSNVWGPQRAPACGSKDINSVDNSFSTLSQMLSRCNLLTLNMSTTSNSIPPNPGQFPISSSFSAILSSRVSCDCMIDRRRKCDGFQIS